MSIFDKRRKELGLNSAASTSQSNQSESIFDRRRRELEELSQIPSSDATNDADMLRSENKDRKKIQISDMQGLQAQQKTPLKQSFVIGGQVPVGMDILPAYEEDTALQKIGKGIINLGGGTVARIGGALGQAGMNITEGIESLVTGRPVTIGEKSFARDVLGVDDEIANIQNPTLRTFVDATVNTVGDPGTFVGGTGVLDDLARAGAVGKSAKLGTTENLLVNAKAGQKATKNLPLTPGKELRPERLPKNMDPVFVDPYGNAADDLRKTPLLLPEGRPISTGESMLDIVRQDLNLPQYFKASGKTDVPNRILPGELPKTTNVLESPLPKTEQPIKSTRKDPDNALRQKERGFSANTRTDINNPDNIRESFSENPLTYEQIHGKDTVAKAEAIFSKGNAAYEFKGIIEGRDFRPETVPLSKMIARDAAARGDMETARVVLSDMAEKLTQAGQFTQAARLLREADPETFLMTIDKQLRKLNEQGLKQYGKKWKDVDLKPEELKAVQEIQRGNIESYDEVWEQIGSRIAKELPSTGMEKFDAWRRIAMLLNPKTHVRNIIGNTIMMGMRKTSDTIGAALEKAFVKEGERTKSVGWSLDKNLAGKVDEAWETNKKDLLGESRWEIDNLKALGREKYVFKTKWLQWLNDASLKSLNWEDNLFVKRAYKDALGQFMKANKLDAVNEAAQTYAKRRAMEATFKQVNWMSEMLRKGKQIPVVGKLVEGAVPFSKTPANIAFRAVEYSPVGLIKALYSKTSGKAAADVVEDLAKGLTGTATVALGFGLASMGWAKANRGTSDKAEGVMRELGEQPYSFNSPLGSYTFDWAQPFAVPLAMGMAMHETLERRKDGDGAIESVVNGLASGGDTIFNMTMLRNIKDILGSGGSPTQKIMGIPLSYIEQAIPTILGQVGRSVDGTVRNTYDPNPIKQEFNKIKSKTGFSGGLEPRLDVFGNEQKQSSPLAQFLSPGTPLANEKDPAAIELKRLYKATKETDFLPKIEDGKITVKGEEIRLKAEQLTKLQREMGQLNYMDIKAKIDSPEYKRADDDTKARMIRYIVNRNYDKSKDKLIRSMN